MKKEASYYDLFANIVYQPENTEGNVKQFKEIKSRQNFLSRVMIEGKSLYNILNRFRNRSLGEFVTERKEFGLSSNNFNEVSHFIMTALMDTGFFGSYRRPTDVKIYLSELLTYLTTEDYDYLFNYHVDKIVDEFNVSNKENSYMRNQFIRIATSLYPINSY